MGSRDEKREIISHLKELLNDSKEIGCYIDTNGLGQAVIDALTSANGHQQTVMLFNPATGDPKPWPSLASHWREHHNSQWQYNPWTGETRDARSIHFGPLGHDIIPPEE